MVVFIHSFERLLVTPHRILDPSHWPVVYSLTESVGPGVEGDCQSKYILVSSTFQFEVRLDRSKCIPIPSNRPTSTFVFYLSGMGRLQTCSKGRKKGSCPYSRRLGSKMCHFHSRYICELFCVRHVLQPTNFGTVTGKIIFLMSSFKVSRDPQSTPKERIKRGYSEPHKRKTVDVQWRNCEV